MFLSADAGGFFGDNEVFIPTQENQSMPRRNDIHSTLAGAMAAAKGIAARRSAGLAPVKALQDYHAEIRQLAAAVG
jgi:hypothetical protein